MTESTELGVLVMGNRETRDFFFVKIVDMDGNRRPLNIVEDHGCYPLLIANMKARILGEERKLPVILFEEEL